MSSPAAPPPIRRPSPAKDAPPWLQWLLTPLLARTIAVQMVAENPGTSAAELVRKVRADTAGITDPAAARMTEALVRNLGPATRAAASAQRSRAPSAIVLVLANLVPLYGVLLLDWPVFPLILLFWAENVLIGVFNVLRMLLLDPADPALWLGKLLLVPFFCLHYGIFAAVHGSFVFGLFGRGSGLTHPSGLFPLDYWIEQIGAIGVWLPLAALAASHLFSLLWNYLGRGEFRVASLVQLMQQPYRRVVVLHIALILGGFAVAALDSPLWALLVLLALKIGFDLRAHVREHGPVPVKK